MVSRLNLSRLNQKRVNLNGLWLLAAIGIGILVCACGYRFPGGGEIPGGIKNVSIPLFINRTNEVGLENIITNDLTNEFIIRRKEALADDDQMADGILRGEIVSVQTRTISQTGAGGSVEREVIVRVDLRLSDSADQIKWVSRNIAARETYYVGGNSVETDLRRFVAIEELSTRLAENIFNRLTENF